MESVAASLWAASSVHHASSRTDFFYQLVDRLVVCFIFCSHWSLGFFELSLSFYLLTGIQLISRILDVHGIKAVVNFDYPNNSEDYVHRIGRTGRRDMKVSIYVCLNV
jgi:superfamily II DNA/RNA helicase